MRGAVSVALVYHYFDPTGKSTDPQNATLVSATSLVVLITLVGAGAATKPMMTWLSGGNGMRVGGSSGGGGYDVCRDV